MSTAINLTESDVMRLIVSEDCHDEKIDVCWGIDVVDTKNSLLDYILSKTLLSRNIE